MGNWGNMMGGWGYGSGNGGYGNMGMIVPIILVIAIIFLGIYVFRRRRS